MTEPLDDEIDHKIWIKASKNWDKYKKLGPHPIHSGNYSDWPQWGEEYDAFFGFSGRNAQWATYPHTIRVPRSAIAKLNILASPHFLILLKAYEAKHGRSYIALNSTANKALDGSQVHVS